MQISPTLFFEKYPISSTSINLVSRQRMGAPTCSTIKNHKIILFFESS